MLKKPELPNFCTAGHQQGRPDGLARLFKTGKAPASWHTISDEMEPVMVEEKNRQHADDGLWKISAALKNDD